MYKKIVTITILASLVLTSCKDTPKQENTTTTTKAVPKTTDEIVTSTSTDKNGKKIEMSFNNTQNTATIKMNGETIQLIGQHPASGIWYKNNNYELTGKGENIELKKDGKTIFKN